MIWALFFSRGIESYGFVVLVVVLEGGIQFFFSVGSLECYCKLVS